MLNERNRGCLWAMQALLITANCLLFLFYLLAERQFGIYGLVSDTRNFAYILAAPISIIYSRKALWEAIQQVRSPSLWHSGMSAIRIISLQAVSIFGLYFFFKDIALSRAFIMGYLAFALILNVVLMYALPSLVTQLFYGDDRQMKAVLFGYGPLPDDLREYVSKGKTLGIRYIGYFAEERLNLPGIEWRGTPDQVLECEGGRKRMRADLAFAYSDEDHVDALREGINTCTRRGARVQVYSNLSSSFIDPIRVITDGKLLFFAFMDEPLQNPINQFLKRFFDILISLPVVLFILPPLAIGVWIIQRFQSPGPIFFKQTRYGVSRTPFTIYKFRTMHVHDRKLEGKQATKGDVRIYPLGKLLRTTSLDEFPQFLNALLGTMSIVGPRPHYTKHDDEFERHYRRYRSRHYVKPGITGLAQTTGFRGEATDEKAIIGRVQQDLRYITEWSIGLEIRIFLKTIWHVFFPPKTAV